MIDAAYFLKNGGQKGPQLTVWPPGKYRLNSYLFDVKPAKPTDIPAGFVGVIKSNVQESAEWELAEVTHELAGSIAVPLVKKGSVGIWDEPLPPGRYYLNRVAYNVTKVDTRVQTWNCKGGYKRRYIDLQVTQDGKIEQKERSDEVSIPENAADSAIFTRMDSWLVPQELRVQVQVEVLDQDRVMQLAVLEKVLKAAVENPDIVKIPQTLVTGTTGGFEGAAAILGASNIATGVPRGIQQRTATNQRPATP